MEHRGASTHEQQEAVRSELDKWNEGYIDLSNLEEELGKLKSANASLKQELQQLRQSNMVCSFLVIFTKGWLHF